MSGDRKMFLLLNGVEYELDEVVTDDTIASRKNRLEHLIVNGGTLQRFPIRTENGVGELLVQPDTIKAASILVTPESEGSLWL